MNCPICNKNLPLTFSVDIDEKFKVHFDCFFNDSIPPMFLGNDENRISRGKAIEKRYNQVLNLYGGEVK